jgi:CTP:molybdopterin cytidylyltransferase MocA
MAGVAGVVLAAGGSTRFESDRPKQLADWFGETLVHRITRVACALLDPVLVVVGHRDAEVRDAVADLADEQGVRVVPNRSWRQGQSSSVRAAVSALESGSTTAVMFLPCDQPGLDEAVLGAMLGAWQGRRPATRALVPTYASQDGARHRGAPVVFAATLFAGLRSLSGDEGGRSLLADLGDALEVVDLPDSACGEDVDTAADLARLRSRWIRPGNDSS